MEGISENQLVTEPRDLAGFERLHRAAGGQWNERRRLNLAVGEVQGAGPGPAVRSAGPDGERLRYAPPSCFVNPSCFAQAAVAAVCVALALWASP